jgi:hypothetical protein
MIYEKISTELKYKIAYTDKQALNFRCWKWYPPLIMLRR